MLLHIIGKTYWNSLCQKYTHSTLCEFQDSDIPNCFHYSDADWFQQRIVANYMTFR